jgi:hypothetical protein
MRNVYKMLIGKPEGKGELVRRRCRLEDNDTNDLKEKGVKVLAGFFWFRIKSSGRLL